ncbi:MULTISPECIES: carbohydrate ABC transporter permease [Halanaerobium]|jgi:multiple sugar transport system permease protein|uniref:Carbohydrate ABC transporter membrane protein 2 (CUT1 family) n=1 Tax=Halanaerobium saccharolyticum TaxID=43595 RepID=A0A4R6SL77_9FIRM|nr:MULTISPECIES: carbohydrate ABC transporter permease [Halanaerobium]PUU93923.1 MAG: multiple sugar transport system permease protein [Halanaerobium sp.]TDQ01719.1 carbohydrate ABC transporter membrane protein 2 (CUT1 family) [Halanaerobium saccharolyticum]
MANDKAENLNTQIKRKRWRNVGAIYVLLLLLSILFMGPFVFGFLSSFKDDPTEWPPTLTSAQLSPENWAGAYRLGKDGGGSGFFGEFKGGESLTFNVSYLYSAEQEIVKPTARIPERTAGSGQAAFDIEQRKAFEYLEVEAVEELNRNQVENGTVVEYQLEIANPSQYDFSQVPLNVQTAYGVEFVNSTLDPNRSERLGMVQSWDNISAGVIPYIFNNYGRVFREQYDRSTGRSLFLSWIRNSFFLSVARVVTTIAFASMAGYALARLHFKGKTLIFFLVLFSMMIPLQVTFISNYLVLRDGIFGLTKLFGVDTLLNTFSGVILWGMISGNSVFIMKQFFEGLPSSMEESARIDGATTFQIFYKIMLPLAKPALGALTVLTFQGAWNDFFLPLVVITSPQEKFPLTVGLLSMRQSYGAGAFDWGPILAGAVISAIPIIILFVVFQRYFVEGISFSGMKG